MGSPKKDTVKFVANGLTFDTSTAKALAVSRGAYAPTEGDQHFPAVQVRFERTLYRSPRNALLFLHEHTTSKFAKGRPVVQDAIRAMTADDAAAWLMKSGAAIIDAEGLQLPPEA